MPPFHLDMIKYHIHIWPKLTSISSYHMINDQHLYMIQCIHDHVLIQGRKTDPSRSNCRLKQHRGDNGKWYHKQAGKSYFWWPFWERKYLVLLSIRFLAQMFLAFYKIRFLIFFFQVPGAGSEPAKHCSPDMSGSWKWKRVMSPPSPLSAGFIIQHVLGVGEFVGEIFCANFVYDLKSIFDLKKNPCSRCFKSIFIFKNIFCAGDCFKGIFDFFKIYSVQPIVWQIYQIF